MARCAAPRIGSGKMIPAVQMTVNDSAGDFSSDGFHILHETYETEARLNRLGRIFTRYQTLRLLANRRRIEEALRRSPDITAVPVARPIVITGLPRTGTTLLHRLLAQDPAHRAPVSWELYHPARTPARGRRPRDARILGLAIAMLGFDLMTPGLRGIHELGAHLPEECIIAHAHSFLSFSFTFSHFVPSYRAWLEQQHLGPAYSFHKRFLQYLQSGWAPERWVLKAPSHLFGLDALLATYPDACIVQAHRDPLAVLGSVTSFVVALRRGLSAG